MLERLIMVIPQNIVVKYNVLNSLKLFGSLMLL